MRALIDFACRLVSFRQPIGYFELVVRLPLLGAVAVGAVALLVPAWHDWAMPTLLIGALGLIAAVASFAEGRDVGEDR